MLRRPVLAAIASNQPYICPSCLFKSAQLPSDYARRQQRRLQSSQTADRETGPALSGGGRPGDLPSSQPTQKAQNDEKKGKLVRRTPSSRRLRSRRGRVVPSTKAQSSISLESSIDGDETGSSKQENAENEPVSRSGSTVQLPTEQSEKPDRQGPARRRSRSKNSAQEAFLNSLLQQLQAERQQLRMIKSQRQQQSAPANNSEAQKSDAPLPGDTAKPTSAPEPSLKDMLLNLSTKIAGFLDGKGLDNSQTGTAKGTGQEPTVKKERSMTEAPVPRRIVARDNEQALKNQTSPHALSGEGSQALLRKIAWKPRTDTAESLESLVNASRSVAMQLQKEVQETYGGLKEKLAIKAQTQAAEARNSRKDATGARSGKPSPTPLKAKKPAKKPPKATTASPVQTIESKDLDIKYIEVEQPPVPGLSYGLDRVLFNPGVYQLQDSRSRVYNFDPYLESIMPISEFDFGALKEYFTSSRDKAASTMAKERGKRYYGSTSSMTSTLNHFHYLLSQWRPINTSMLSQGFPEKLHKFTELQRSPAAVFLKLNEDNVYAIDADKEFDSANVLSLLGKSMEKLLTLNKDEYERYRKSNSGAITEEERAAPESYHYSEMGDFLMRSQLDAYDPRLPGTGMFDLKTRAVVTVRMDAENFEVMKDYEIIERYGQWESYEREYYDMIRSVMLKYSLQVRMGRMDGIFVAFHNTTRIFGFQYVPVGEMDLALHGQSDTNLGDREFKLSLDLLNKVLDKATAKFPNKSLRMHFETREGVTPFMYIFAEPVEETDIEAIQTRNKEKIDAFEQKVFNLQKEEVTDGSSWDEIQSGVEEALERDEAGEHESISYEDVVSNGDDVEGHTPGSSADLTSTEKNIPEDLETDEAELGLLISGSDAVSATPMLEESATASGDDQTNTEEEPQLSPLATTDISSQADKLVYKASDDEATFPATPQLQSEIINDQATLAVIDDASSAVVPEDTSTSTDSETAKHEMPAEESEETTVDQGISLTDALTTSSKDDAGTVTGLTLAEAMKAPSKKEKEEPIPKDIDASKPLLAMILTMRNKVNDHYVVRPVDLKKQQPWKVEYTLEEVVKPERAWSLYRACQLRRKRKLEPEDDEDPSANYYWRMMRDLSAKGEKHRRKLNVLDQKDAKGIVVLGQEPPQAAEKVSDADVGTESKTG